MVARSDLVEGSTTYATFGMVADLVPEQDFTDTSRPTESAAAGIIHDSFNLLNGLLTRLGYDVPIGTQYATAFSQAARLQSFDSASIIEGIAYSTNLNRSEHGEFLKGLRDEYWKQIREGDMYLIGAPRTGDSKLARGSERQPEAQFLPRSGGLGGEEEPVFTRNMRW